MPAGTTSTLTKAEFDRAIGSRLLQMEAMFKELGEIKAWTDGKTDAELVDFFGAAYTLEDAQNIKGALAHVASTESTWVTTNHDFVDRLTAPGVRT